MVTLLDQVFVAGMEIVAPVVIALIILWMRHLAWYRAPFPQMNVFFVGLPAKIMLGFLGSSVRPYRSVCLFPSQPDQLLRRWSQQALPDPGLMSGENRTERATPEAPRRG